MSSKTRFSMIHSPQKTNRTTPTSKSFPRCNKKNSGSPVGEEPNKMTETEIAQIGKPLRQNICVEMLRDGFPHSFKELFALLQRWDEEDDDPLKLQTLQLHLTRAEAAERSEKYDEAYENHMLMARFFTEDKWMKHHFLELALRSARKVIMDSGKREAEARSLVGQAYLEKGDLELAQEHLEVFYQLTAGRTWQDSNGRMQHSRSCEELQTVYTLMAQRSLQDQQYEQAIKMSRKAYTIAKESGDRALEGEAAYRLGLAYQSTGDQKIAMKFLSSYMEIALTLEDTDSLGRAHEAMAKCLESEGKITEAIELWEKYVETCKSSKHDQNLERAYMNLGHILKSQKRYGEARVYFERAFELVCLEGCPRRVQEAQVYVGITRALSTFPAYMKLIQDQNLDALLAWKDRREDRFSSAASSEPESTALSNTVVP
ncbi:tetratricopeptide repeat protein 29 [Danio rerio]|uniref:Tetratricopeptide repeat domain 29 n=1 Tax=Danio rerio TaxID=7955 RepID=A0ACD6B6C7_DANRE|nr:tetratricopeptide repeat protein 29 [Danio rerio]XP_017206870.1 tetratricopeptide repeat protein 29 isoform X1 [Danio rerio]|eukprot:NP_001315084.1 tetratricopeptide repeat protein 29 [Danio rerio]